MHLRNQNNRVVFEKPGEPTGGAAPLAPVAESAKPASPSAEPPAAAAPAEPTEPPAKPTAPAKDWKDDRIAKLTHDLNEERRKNATQSAPIQKPGESDADFDRRVNEAALPLAQQIAAQEEFNKQCNAVVETGRGEFKDFDDRLSAIKSTINGQDLGEIQAYNEVITAALETGKAHKVLYALGADPGEYQKLVKMSPVRRAMYLGKMAADLENAPAPSGAPKPITPINSSGEHYEGIRPDDPNRGTKLPIKEWMKQREAQVRERGIQ